MGYDNIGHSEPANKNAVSEKEETKSNNKVVLGDDPGVMKYLQMTGTVMLCDVPYLKDAMGARLFTSAELIYYPSLYNKCNENEGLLQQVKNDCRASIGIGINVPVNPMFHF